jgi:hypothetical protein
MERIHFRAVDLEIESYQDLQPIVAEFGDRVRLLYCGNAQKHYLATFEASYEGPEVEADATIAHFCLLISCFEPPAKALWDGAFTKVFDIGYQSGLEPSSYTSEIRMETIEQVAALGASIRITIYPADKR